ncbi:MAG: hypothetical protein KJ770_05650 [Actinobacteria bacterium]|nr:hypothetical protein [Actinomycetota bacterium]
MNIALNTVNYTANYVRGYTYTNQDYVKRYPMIEIIYECDMEDFKLNTPIAVSLEQDYNDWAAYDSITGIYSFGDTQEEAKKNFCYAMEDVYKFLLDDVRHLTPLNKNTLNYLEKILSRK